MEPAKKKLLTRRCRAGCDREHPYASERHAPGCPLRDIGNQLEESYRAHGRGKPFPNYGPKAPGEGE